MRKNDTGCVGRNLINTRRDAIKPDMYILKGKSLVKKINRVNSNSYQEYLNRLEKTVQNLMDKVSKDSKKIYMDLVFDASVPSIELPLHLKKKVTKMQNSISHDLRFIHYRNKKKTLSNNISFNHLSKVAK